MTTARQQTARPAPRPTVAPLHRPGEALTLHLLAAGEEMDRRGLRLLPVGPGKTFLSETPPDWDEVAALLRDGTAHGLAVILGADSFVEDDSDDATATVLVGVDLPPETRPWADRWSAALTASGASRVWERIENGWVTVTPAGDRRHIFFAQVPSNATYVEALLADLDTAGQREAKLLTARAIVAPSGGALDPTGGVYRPASKTSGLAAAVTISVRDLHTITAAIATTSQDETGTPELDPETAAVRNTWTRRVTDAATVELLTTAGWVKTRQTSDGAIRMANGRGRLAVGGAHRPAGSVWVQRPAGDLATGWHSAWDTALAATGREPADLAEQLVADGRVTAPAVSILAAERPAIEVKHTPANQQIDMLLAALTEARHPVVDMPLVLARRLGGKPVSLVSLSPGGRSVREWPEANPALVATSVAEPYARSKSGPTLAAWPPTVVSHATSDAITNVESGRGVTPVDIIASRPVLLRSGVSLAEPGWYPAHRALLLPPDGDWQRYRVPPQPTREEAQARLELLNNHLLANFPFESPSDRARAICWLLTCAGRELVDTAPVFPFTATQPGSGKGLLASLGRIIANGHGRFATMSPFATYDEEAEKRLVAEVLERPGDVHFAHVDEMPAGSKLTSALLSQIATSLDGYTTLRRLGANQNIPIAGCIISLCGNNIVIGADFARRVLPVHLLWRGECRPEDRRPEDFAHDDLAGWVMRRRPGILAACHTILLRALTGDAPKPTVTIGSYETWCNVVLRSLTDITLPGDKCSVAETALADMTTWKAEHDTSNTEWEAFFYWWSEAWGSDRVPAAAVVGALDVEHCDPGLPPMECDIPSAVLAQMEAHGRSQMGARKAVGVALTGILGRQFDVEGVGRVALQAATRHGAKMYFLRRVDGSELPAPADDRKF